MARDFDEVLEASSLGTPQARALRRLGHEQLKGSMSGMTAEQMMDEALGCLGGWMSTYTEPSDNSEPQRRMRVIDNGDDYVDVQADGARETAEPTRCYRIRLVIEELT